MARMPNLQTEMPKHFFRTAALFEGGLVPVAIVLGWLLGAPPLKTFRFDLFGVVLGIAATAPPLGLCWLCLKCPWQPLKTIANVMDETVVPLFRDCRLFELALIAVLAGLGEEMLFRGVVQAAVAEQIGGPHGVWLGLLIAAMLFGL